MKWLEGGFMEVPAVFVQSTQTKGCVNDTSSTSFSWGTSFPKQPACKLLIPRYTLCGAISS